MKSNSKFQRLKSKVRHFSLQLLAFSLLLLVIGCAGLQDNRSVSLDAFPYYSQAPGVLKYYWCQNPAASMTEPRPWRGNAEIWSGPANWRVENVGTR